jgi:hypothetical protein
VFEGADVPSKAAHAKGLDRRHIKRSPRMAELDPPLACRSMKLSLSGIPRRPLRLQVSVSKFITASAVAFVNSFTLCSTETGASQMVKDEC